MDRKRNSKKKEKDDITIMLFSHSQKKPVQFTLSRFRLRLFRTAAITLLCFAGGSLLYSAAIFGRAARAGSLQAEVRQLKEARDQMQTENSALRSAAEQREEAFQELSSVAERTLKDLEGLHAREDEIRTELGLQALDNTAESVDLLQMEALVASQSDAYNSYTAIMASEEFQNEKKRKTIASLRQKAVDFAEHFLGGSYVYGGENPNSGVDCSGFSRYVLANAAGIFLNRTAASQSTQGREISIDSAKPGDLIFYGNGSGVNHVAIYMGNGRVVHASNERRGIIESAYDYRTPVTIRNVFGD